VRYSRRNRRGGDKIDDIQEQLDRIQQQVNEIKNSSSTNIREETITETPSVVEPVREIINKSWVDDKNKKFKDGAGGRISLSFPRLISLIDNNISKGNTKKDWSNIKSELNNADTAYGVQDIINKYSISFASNYVAGTRRRKRHGKRKTHRRY